LHINLIAVKILLWPTKLAFSVTNMKHFHYLMTNWTFLQLFQPPILYPFLGDIPLPFWNSKTINIVTLIGDLRTKHWSPCLSKCCLIHHRVGNGPRTQAVSLPDCHSSRNTKLTFNSTP